MTMSYENMAKIRKIYDEVIGLYSIDHISINVVNPNDEMSIISYNPSIAHTIIKDGSYIYNGSISPDFYENKEIYTWDEAYDPRVKDKIKFHMQIKHSIDLGCVLVKKTNDHYVLFSFAKKSSGEELFESIEDNKNLYYSVGNHCLSLLKDIFGLYSNNNGLYDTNLKLVVSNN
jgi:hypothetical protein